MNVDAASTAKLRADAASIVSAAIAAADPAPAVERALARFPDVTAAARVHVIAIGKAAPAMTRAALRHVHAAGIDIIVPHGADVAELEDVDGIRIIQAGHPLPDLSSLAAGNALDELIASDDAGDVLLFLISGGASALAILPEGRITFLEYAQCTDLLMRAGADIHQLNTVRHHIDSLKGGGIARRTTHTHVVALILSDVIGDPLDLIASGPLTPPRDTAADAVRVLRDFGVWEQCAPSIREVLTDALRTRDDVPTAHVRTHIVAGNRTALDGAAAEARRLGYDVRVVDEPVTGEAREVGVRIAREAMRLPPRTCLVAGGETSVTVRGAGRGGRSQELALAAAIALHDHSASHILIAACGTDGIDGPTDAAGAITGIDTVDLIGIDTARTALRNNDSHSALQHARALIRTGPTGTNVADIVIAIAAP